MRYTTRNQQETQALGAALARQLEAGQVVAFSGSLGAGKTAFARGILQGLGYTGAVTSPTFTIVNEYRGGKLDVAHFDMYRIHSEDALYSTGYYDYLDGRYVVLIEWSEQVDWAIDANAVLIHITGSGDAARDIEIKGLSL